MLKNRKEFCTKAMLTYNKKLPKKLLIAFGLGLIYSLMRIKVKVNPEEVISFSTTLLLIVSFLSLIVVIDHIRLLNKIKKDIKEVDDMMTGLKN